MPEFQHLLFTSYVISVQWVLEVFSWVSNYIFNYHTIVNNKKKTDKI